MSGETQTADAEGEREKLENLFRIMREDAANA